ncbi:MAG: hypothetical protein JST26_09100 [Bacteroidetes bacterium]|nr:hypothetical protein [Bacteroidota bacterium]
MLSASTTKKALRIWTAAVIMSLGATVSLHAQSGFKLKDGLRYYIDSKDSSLFIKLNMCSQIWLRYNENNPNSAVQGTPQDYTTDASIRRIRFVLSGQLSDRISFFVQFGQNNLNYLAARKAGSFFHDVTADYAVIKKKFSLGFGLNGWNGPSRFSNTSVGSIMVLDPPGYQEVTNDTYDIFVRRLGVYAKGKLGKLDYRLSAAKPFVIQTTTVDPINTNSTFSTLPPNLVYQGYLMYQFLDQESNAGPGTAGTYLGNKRVFNIGGGFFYQKNAMFHQVSLTQKDTVQQDIMLAALDVFYDTPVNKDRGTAFNVYACYSNYNYGSKFIKVSGPDNPASSTSLKTPTLFNKASYGNAFPYLGTGNVYYIQTAYKFKNNLLGNQGTLQVYGDCQYADYTRLKDPMVVFDAGINWLIKGHNSKFTLNYQNRPCFFEDAFGDVHQQTRKGSYVLQYQLAF